MHLSAVLTTLFVAVASATSHGVHLNRRNHHDLAARDLDTLDNATALVKRGTFSNSRFTFFADGLGACGKTNSPDDFIVALNSAQYSGGAFCFDMITITINGKTTQAQITDECPGCPYGGLDFSDGLFKFFADESVGVLTGSWFFSSQGGGGDASPSSSSPSPTSTWSPPPPTTTWSPTPTSTWSPPPSSSSSSWSSSSSSSFSSSSSSSSSTHTPTPEATSTVEQTVSINISSGAASGLAEPTGSSLTPSQAAGSNLYLMDLAIVNMGALVKAGASL